MSNFCLYLERKKLFQKPLFQSFFRRKKEEQDLIPKNTFYLKKLVVPFLLFFRKKRKKNLLSQKIYFLGKTFFWGKGEQVLLTRDPPPGVPREVHQRICSGLLGDNTLDYHRNKRTGHLISLR
jgi:hypothetical protein